MKFEILFQDRSKKVFEAKDATEAYKTALKSTYLMVIRVTPLPDEPKPTKPKK